MGEFHPAERKVVVEFCPADFDLTPVQELKLKKLVGPRYNPETEIVHMSCEMFEHQAQNKRYLSDMVDKLIAEAKVRSDLEFNCSIPVAKIYSRIRRILSKMSLLTPDIIHSRSNQSSPKNGESQRREGRN